MPRDHLTGPEIEWLLRPELSGCAGSNSEARAHCEECSQCAALVSAHQEASQDIESLKQLSPNSEHPTCPAEEQWLELAAGLCGEGRAMQLLEHAALCRACSQLLRQAQEYLSASNTGNLRFQSSTPEWQRRIAEQIAGYSAAPRPAVLQWRYSRRKWWVYAPLSISAAAALLLLFFHSWFFRPNLEQLLAVAYSQKRTLESRIPGAAYADWHEERTSDQESVVTSQSPIEKPAAAVRELCRKTPESDDCLIYGAQVDVLAGGYKAALAGLAQVKAESESENFLLVRAQAEFQQGEMEGKAMIYTSSYGQAIEDLSRVLNSDRHNPVALFNRALAYERLQSFKAAEADWQEMLKVEKDPGWAAEAKRHLDAIREKQKSRLDKLKLLYDPVQSYQDLLRISGVDPDHSEAYFETAVEQWLPPARISVADLGPALSKLAIALRYNHHDAWLGDFLAVGSAPQPVILLRSAIAANTRGDLTQAARQALLAQAWFDRDGNFAGSARSRFEFVYAQHRQFNSSACLRAGFVLRHDLQRHSYTWLQIELLLEIFGCELMSSNFDRAQEIVDEALREAGAAHYPVLQLRAASFKTSSRRTEGQLNRFWTEVQEEIANFWSDGFYPAERGYQGYADLEFAAEEAGQWRLAEAFQQEALSLIEETAREDLKAYAHFRLAQSAEMAGELLLAREEFDAAHKEFSQLPATEATRRLQADAAIALAAIETHQGEIEPAKQLLKEAEPQLQRLESFLPQLNFSLANAEVARNEQHWQEEQDYLEDAVRIGNDGFRTIHSQPERWNWRLRMETGYRRLFELDLRTNPEPAKALAEWETFRAAEVQGGVLLSKIHSNSAEAELLPQTAKLHDSTLAAFVVLPDRIQAWVADDRGIEQYSIAGSANELEQKVLAFYRLCSNPASDSASQKRLAGKLYQLLLGPLQAKLDPRRVLLIEADGPLANLPWLALLAPDGNYLGEIYSLAVTPGVFYRETSFPPESRQTPGKILVAVPGPVSFDSRRLAPLPQAQEEVQVLLRLSPDTVYLRGTDANLQGMRRYLPQAILFHFAGHAAEFQHGGELILAGDGPENALKAADLSGLPLSRCRLVVLSACSTAMAEHDILRNPDGLVQAFLKSGAERVIASRWNVDSGATGDFMRAFYESLQAGYGVAAALRMARRHIRSDSRMAAPYYWASFEAFGAAGVSWSSPVLTNLVPPEPRSPAAKEQAAIRRP